MHKYFDEKLGKKHDLDILSWWMGEQFRYPILSSLARDVLSIPISTVASKSAFSIGGTTFRSIPQFSFARDGPSVALY